jgi:uncharacterized membrane-anchored protein YhcB (DUF1043 family)
MDLIEPFWQGVFVGVIIGGILGMLVMGLAAMAAQPNETERWLDDEEFARRCDWYGTSDGRPRK